MPLTRNRFSHPDVDAYLHVARMSASATDVPPTSTPRRRSNGSMRAPTTCQPVKHCEIEDKVRVQSSQEALFEEVVSVPPFSRFHHEAASAVINRPKPADWHRLAPYDEPVSDTSRPSLR